MNTSIPNIAFLPAPAVLDTVSNRDQDKEYSWFAFSSECIASIYKGLFLSSSSILPIQPNLLQLMLHLFHLLQNVAFINRQLNARNHIRTGSAPEQIDPIEKSNTISTIRINLTLSLKKPAFIKSCIFIYSISIVNISIMFSALWNASDWTDVAA